MKLHSFKVIFNRNMISILIFKLNIEKQRILHVNLIMKTLEFAKFEKKV